MRYFGISKCPYCNKRVNLIRTWSLKRQGEYKCPRCQGISNVFLSPLIHVAAVISVFSAGVLYFFHKFVLNDVGIKTALYIFLPFVGFYVLSLFMVYLEKPVIKKKKMEKKRGMASHEAARRVKHRNTTSKAGEGLNGKDSFQENIDSPKIQAVEAPPQYTSQVNNPVSPQTSSRNPVVKHQAPVQVMDPRYVREEPPKNPPPQHSIEVTMPIFPRKPDSESRVVQKIEIGNDIFQKYEDPEYVKKRMEDIDGEQ